MGEIWGDIGGEEEQPLGPARCNRVRARARVRVRIRVRVRVRVIARVRVRVGVTCGRKEPCIFPISPLYLPYISRGYLRKEGAGRIVV